MKPFSLLVFKEIKEIFFSKTTMLFLMILSFMTGYSFYSAVALYSKASMSAIDNPLYAAGFEPVSGIFVPTWGGVFVLFSLFLPFVIIPVIVLEKERNTLVMLLQIPFTMNEILLSKIIASVLLLLFIFLSMTPALFIWWVCGGHIPWGELVLLQAGYLLYGLCIIAVSMCSASLFKNTASASIFSILLITLSWIVDFGKDMNISPLIVHLSHWTTSHTLKFFEQGIFSLSAVLYFLILFVVFMSLSRSFLDVSVNVKWLFSSLLIILSTGILIISYFHFNADMTESHRNSFPTHITAALKKIPPLEIDVYLERTDSRFKDYEESFLNRLRLIKKDITLHIIQDASLLDQHYGLFVYTLNGKKATTYSNSEEEIFPLIFRLAGIRNYDPSAHDNFSGYPLVFTDNQLAVISYTYYLVIPFILLSGVITRKIYTKRRFT